MARPYFFYQLGILVFTFCVSLGVNILFSRKLRFYPLASYQEKQELFLNTIHEIRNALTLIILPLERIKKKSASVPKELQNHVETAYSNTNYLLTLSEELLEFSRTKSDAVELSKESINIGGFIFEMINIIRPIAEEKGLSLHFEQTSEKVFIKGDKDLLKKAFLNLLANAIKFTLSGGKVEISTHLSGNGAMIKIEDTGKGIPQEDLDRIFERFYRSPSHVSTHKGTGIGLALVREIIHKHGGEISGKSSSKKGTAFTLWLPITKDNDRNNNTSSDISQLSKGNSSKDLSANSLSGKIYLPGRETFEQAPSKMLSYRKQQGSPSFL